VRLSAPDEPLEVRLQFRGPGADLAVARLTTAQRQSLLEILSPLLAPPAARAPPAAGPLQGPAVVDLVQDPPPHILRLADRLSVQQGLDGPARIRRAPLQGVRDERSRLRLANGERVAREPSPLPRLRTEWCVCLAGTAGAPFWTPSVSRYNSRVRIQNRPRNEVLRHDYQYSGCIGLDHHWNRCTAVGPSWSTIGRRRLRKP